LQNFKSLQVIIFVLSNLLKCRNKVAGNGQGLLLRWHSKFLSPERQPDSEPIAEDKYKSRTMNVAPGTADEQRTTADFIPSASVEANPMLAVRAISL